MESAGAIVRLYRPGDEDAILAMYEAVVGRRRSLEEWRWRFLGPPAGPALILVLEQEGALVGQWPHVPMPTWVDGRRLLLGLGGDTMVLPSSRGQGGLRRLVEAFFAMEHGFDLRMNSPNAMARPLFVRYEAGVVIGKLPRWIRRHTLTRPLPGLLRPPARAVLAASSFLADQPPPALAVGPLAELGAEVDELGEASASFARCIRVRDAAYLRWRWLEQPEARWEIRAARERDGRLAGIAVPGSIPGRGLTGTIADLLARHPSALRALLVDGVATLVGQGASSVTFNYLDPRPWARRALLRSGFLPAPSEIDVMCRSLSPTAGPIAEQLGSWYLTLSDVAH